ncbi:MAG TPA: hypothetical protein VNN09_01725 [Candidatus Competibacteraceae bacterium]|nr:hypothetical protein [Candidatus Competibacteraceae bacterium]
MWIPIARSNPFRLPFFIAAAGLVLTILPWGFGFYMLLRLIVSACAA